MRLLNSVCKVISDYYEGIPVHIEEMPVGFTRGCFLVTLTTESSNLKNYNIYQDDPMFQIVYFAERNAANQGLAENLYKVKEELKALFLLKRCVKVIDREDIIEKKRYAKIESYSDEVRLDEAALYVKMTLNFTEDVPVNDDYDLMENVDIENEITTKG